MSRALTPYDATRVEEWYLGLPDAALEIAKKASHEDESGAYELLALYFDNPDLVEAFAGSVKLKLPPPSDIFSRWYIAAWGRRCSTYLGAISNGLLKYGKNNHKEVLERAKNISNDADQLYSKYKQKRTKEDTLWRSLDIEHGIINFHVTYLDPVLFSALHALRKIGNKFTKEGIGSDIYQEAGITEENFSDIQDSLMKIVKKEVKLYIPKGESKSNVLVDDSTLWWGIYELVRYYGERFDICDKKYLGMSGAANLVQKLIDWTRESLSYPTFELANVEITSEIHCQLRTQLWIANSGLNLYKLQWPQEVKEQVLSSLKGMIEWSLLEALEIWDKEKDKEQQLQKHAYFIGLALEVLCHYQSVLGDFENASMDDGSGIAKHDEGENYYATKWTTTGEEYVNRNTFDELVRNKDTFDIFVIDRGELQSRRVGRVYFRGIPGFRAASKRVRQLAYGKGSSDEKFVTVLLYQILVHTLKRKGDAGDVINIAEACWPDGTEFVERLRSERKLLTDGKITNADYHDSNPAKHVRKAVGDLSTVLKDRISVILQTQLESDYRLSPIPEYCLLVCGDRVDD